MYNGNMVQEKNLRAARQNYDRLSRWYDWFSSSERRISVVALRLLDIQPGEKVLEIGFGTGHALLDLAGASGRNGSVDGVDISPGMVSVARRRVQHSGMGGTINIQVGDATHLPYPDHHFDVAFMSFTLELFHPTLIPVVLAECKRVLLPGARLGVVSLVKKEARAVEIYEWFHTHLPGLVDCRPIYLLPVLEMASFEVAQTVEERLWGLPVEAVVARKP